jgi:ABC-type multidrug transport system ATPase subunit
MSSEVVLRARNLQKRFGQVTAVADVSLAVHRGEVLGFLGPNGAGKTTTIGMLLGLVRPTGGTAELFGEPVRPGCPALRRVGAMPAPPAVLPGFSARRNLRCAALLHPDLPAGRVDEVLGLVGLAGVADRRAGTFSTGMRQRLGLGLALLARPDLLVLDEPASGLDPEGIHHLRTVFRTLAGEGVTIFLSSHLLHEVELTCDRVAVVHEGHIVAQGTVAELTGAGGDRVAVTTADPERTGQVLRSLPGASDVEVGPGRVVVSGLTSEVVVYNLVTGGVTPSQVVVVRPDLEDLFLQLTGERGGGERGVL